MSVSFRSRSSSSTAKTPTKGTKRGRELLEKSLERYGAGRSVLVDRHDRVIAGNKTVEAAVAAGLKSIAVIETDGSSLVAVQRGDLDLAKDKKARELAIADNRVGELDLVWNPEVLASLDVDLDLFWNENELNALLKDFRSTELAAPDPKLDQAAELQEKWRTKRGQIWEIGEHRLMCGDSTKGPPPTTRIRPRRSRPMRNQHNQFRKMNPTDFPVGSVASRAVARTLAKSRESSSAYQRSVLFDWIARNGQRQARVRPD
jgi:hypothetical protein